MLFLHLAVQLSLVIDIFVGSGQSRSRTEEWFQSDATIAIIVVLCIFLLLDLVAFSLIIQLLTFHIKLRRDGLTTYSFIVQDNQKRREKSKSDNELANRRVQEIEKAKGEGQACHRWKLEVGGLTWKMCGIEMCDPLRQNKGRNQPEGAAEPLERPVINPSSEEG